MKLLRLNLIACWSAWALCASRAGCRADPDGRLGPFTGGSSPMGVSMRDGIRLAAAEINASGGVLGRQSNWSNATTRRATSAAQRSCRN